MIIIFLFFIVFKYNKIIFNLIESLSLVTESHLTAYATVFVVYLENNFFQHWILSCPPLNQYSNLFVIHLTPLEISKTIYSNIFTFHLGGTLVLNELQIDKAEQKHLNEQL